MEREKNMPMQTLSEVPVSKEGAKKIVGLVKESGVVTGYKLSSGEVVSKFDAVELARDGGIAGVGVAKNGNTEYLRSIPDETEVNNLGDLPTITK